jgi:hypothetical protein
MSPNDFNCCNSLLLSKIIIGLNEKICSMHLAAPFEFAALFFLIHARMHAHSHTISNRIAGYLDITRT